MEINDKPRPEPKLQPVVREPYKTPDYNKLSEELAMLPTMSDAGIKRWVQQQQH